MFGENFEESIKQKRKLLLNEGESVSAPTSQVTTPAKTLPKTTSAAALDIFAEHTNAFSDNVDVSFLRVFLTFDIRVT